MLQTIWHQINNAQEVYVDGKVLDDDTVMGGTGWGAEFAKPCNEPVHVSDQDRNGWLRWTGSAWEAHEPTITHLHFAGPGARFLRDNGKAAITHLFDRPPSSAAIAMLRRRAVCIGLALLLSSPAVHAAPPPTPGAPVALDVHVLKAYPHDPEAFTQGLLLHNGTLYESTGRYGVSDLRAVERDTGRVLRSTPLSTMYFGEGLALVGERLIQLTLAEHVAFEYDLSTFRPVGEFTYTTPGWGLCYDGARIVMSDGSDTLYFRDPVTFAVTGRISVTLNGRPRTALNELECVGDAVFANIWQTDTIVKVDLHTGAVTAIINASGLLTPAERAHANVLNGIAYDAHRDTFLITGKLWPKLFEVQFVPHPP